MYIQKSNISKLKNEVIEVVPEYTNSKYEDLVGSFLKNHFFFFPRGTENMFVSENASRSQAGYINKRSDLGME